MVNNSMFIFSLYIYTARINTVKLPVVDELRNHIITDITVTSLVPRSGQVCMCEKMRASEARVLSDYHGPVWGSAHLGHPHGTGEGRD